MTFRALLWLFVVFSTLSVSVPAVAQTIAIGPVLNRRDGRPSGLKPDQVNREDCLAGEDGDKVGFSFSLVGTSDKRLEVYSGNTTCDDPTALPTLITNKQCWQVYADTKVPQTVDIRVRDIIPHGNSPDGPGTGTADACSTGTGQVTLYFILIDTSTNKKVGTTASKPILYDLDGPEAPTKLSIGIGDTRLYPSWQSSNSNSTKLRGYSVYCEQVSEDATPSDTTASGGTTASSDTTGSGGTTPSGDTTGTGGTTAAGDETAGGAATSNDVIAGGAAGNGDTTASGGTSGSDATGGSGNANGNGACKFQKLVPGQPPPIDLKSDGDAGQYAVKIEATGLENNKFYACGIAARDDFNNVGVLSEAVCGTPLPVDGYFKRYRENGGEAGGGYCAFGRSRAPLPAFFATIAVSLWLLRRRGRRFRTTTSGPRIADRRTPGQSERKRANGSDAVARQHGDSR